jgi:hypothetical protein
MDKDKYLEDKSLILEDKVGSKMEVVLTAIKTGNDWKVSGRNNVSLTLDGEHWGEVNFQVVTYDKDEQNAVGTVFYSLMGGIDGEEFLEAMYKELFPEPEEE